VYKKKPQIEFMFDHGSRSLISIRALVDTRYPVLRSVLCEGATIQGSILLRIMSLGEDCLATDTFRRSKKMTLETTAL